MNAPEIRELRAAPEWWAHEYERAILNESLLKMPPSVLYHYTTQAGLLGILDKREIWATHTQYLNDRQEFRYALAIFREELEALALQNSDIEQVRCIQEMREVVQDELSGTNVCVASFSEESDSLSQWRGYAGNAGFAIGFEGEYLASLTAKDHAYLAPCIYESDRQRTVVQALLQEVIEQNLSPQRLNQRPGGNLSAYLLRFAPLLKHRSFGGEREWRIITTPHSCGIPRFCFRPGTSTLTPYYRFPLAEEGIPFRVSRVIVGPTPHEREARASVGSLLVRLGLNEVAVTNSEVPYRNW
jgi:hypothetical protein